MWIEYGYVGFPPLVYSIGRGTEPQVYFATDISAQRSTRRCLGTLEESMKMLARFHNLEIKNWNPVLLANRLSMFRCLVHLSTHRDVP